MITLEEIVDKRVTELIITFMAITKTRKKAIQCAISHCELVLSEMIIICNEAATNFYKSVLYGLTVELSN